MAKEAYYCTVKELNKLGRDAIPAQLRSNTHLIYSSPATLAFNSPGAEGFGVKRAGLAVPFFLSDDGRDRYRNGTSFEKDSEGSRRNLQLL